MTVPSLADAGIFVAGAAFAIKILFPLFKNGKSNGNGALSEAEWRGEVRTMLQTQTATLASLTDNIARLTTVTIEIERRTRDSDRAIRKILGVVP